VEVWQAVAVLVAIAASFLVSAAAGLGGSLVLVPTLVLALDAREGVAVASLLLAGNNVLKVAAYRRTLPLRRVWPLVALTAVGAFLGARLLVAVPESVVTAAVLGSFVLTFLAERLRLQPVHVAGAPALAFASGATSGFSGTSGPLKGVAIRNLRLDRLHTVGAASLASLAGDVTKTAVFTEAGLLGTEAAALALASVPLMVGATWAGRRLNSTIGEHGYSALFWAVMLGYSVRLLVP
jgi:uncharacterized membrane protein YfcA